MTQYAELAVTTNFSFLQGASHAEELVRQARTLGLSAIGVADRNTLAGVVRAHIAAKEVGLRLLVGARLVPEDGPELICYPTDRKAYGRLSRLLSLGKLRAPKGECHFTLDDVINHGDGQIFIVIPPQTLTAEFEHRLRTLGSIWKARVYLAMHHDFSGQARERLGRLWAMAQRVDIPPIAINDVLYHVAERRPLQDVLTCIRNHCQIDQAGFLLQSNAERHLKPPSEMYRLFSGYEEAVARTQDIVRQCTFSLDELAYEYPDEPVPAGKTPQQHLEDCTWQGAKWRYPNGISEKTRLTIEKELSLIRELDYAPYFLTVYDIVAWARSNDILCQGRGSAANSTVCFCLGITSVDPTLTSLLFERFLSKERKEPPDIDVDFEHERREEVIQYVYRRYTRERAALTATVISYRPRSAVREVCKALGLSEDVASALAGTVWGSFGSDIKAEHIHQVGLDPENPLIRRAIVLTRQLIGFPRHLSQHVGGFVLTRGPLIETVPVGNAAMPDRTFIEWDKDDIAALNIMKVDVLALGMLTCLRKALDLLSVHKGIEYDLASVPQDDAATYDMLCRGESLGVFQVESRAQMNMLPRLRPRKLYDLVIEVAIVRPGPIQGDMVHPYLRRRQGLESVNYPSPSPEHGPQGELTDILSRTMGVPLFQEQAMQIAMDAAKFTPEEANGLRRAMATFRKVGTIENYQSMMVERMVHRGYDRDFSQRCFDQVKGFGEYGFPESHAASFALLVYVSSWLKCHHPDIFCTSLLNSQPMGFYAPAQIVRDARENGVTVLPVDVNESQWDNVLVPAEGRYFAVQLGFRQVDGLPKAEADALIAARAGGYEKPEDIRRRSGIKRKSLECLAAADTFRSMGLDRREALWAARGESPGSSLPLFSTMDTDEQGDDAVVNLPEMPLSEHVIQDYQTTRLSLKDHPISFLRDRYERLGALRTKEACSRSNGQPVMVCGVVLVRQKPGSAKGVCFITLEDEVGIANLVVWPNVFARYRSVVMGARILMVRGRVQTADNVVHIVADELIDRTSDLSLLTEEAQADPLKHVLDRADEVRKPIPERKGPAPRSSGRHPRDVRIIPAGRNFH